MEDEVDQRRERAESIFLLVTIAVLSYLAFLIFRPFLEWIILGFLFAYLFRTPYLHTLSLVRRRGAAAAIWLFLIICLFLLPFVLATFFLLRDVTAFAQSIQSTSWNDTLVQAIEDLSNDMGWALNHDHVQSSVNAVAEGVRRNAAFFFAQFATNIVELGVKLLIGFFLFGFTVFYGFVDGPRFRAAIVAAIPLQRTEKELLIREVQVVTDAVFVGHVLIAFIQALIGTIGFFVLGVPRTFLWGFIMLVAALIPVIGPFVVWVPVGLFVLLADVPVNGLFSDSHVFAGWGILLVVGPIVSTIDNLLRPKLVSSRSHTHPLIVLVGAVGGLFVLGFTGFVVGPLILAMLIAVLRVYRAHWRGEALDPDDPRVLNLASSLGPAPKGSRLRRGKKA